MEKMYAEKIYGKLRNLFIFSLSYGIQRLGQRVNQTIAQKILESIQEMV